MLRIVIADDGGQTTVVPLVRDEITIGRGPKNIIRLTERNVSREHARLVTEGDAVFIEDLTSHNGVRVNGDPVSERVALSPGDQIRIGDYQIAFQDDTTAIDGRQSVAGIPLSSITSPARLVMLTQPAPGAEFPLAEGRTRIGRKRGVEVWIDHASISRVHAEIQQDGDAFLVQDLDSANGVQINGEAVTRRRIKPGDVLEFGLVRLKYIAEGSPYSFDVRESSDEIPVAVGQRSKRRLAWITVAVAIAAGAALGWWTETRSSDAADEGEYEGQED